MPSMDAARPALAAWVLLAASVSAPALAQTSAPSGNPQSAPSDSGVATGNPQQELAGAPEPGLGITYGGEVNSKVQVDGRFNRIRSGYAEIYAKSVATAYVNLVERPLFRPGTRRNREGLGVSLGMRLCRTTLHALRSSPAASVAAATAPSRSSHLSRKPCSLA